MKKVPMRTCIVTREKISKYDLLRVVKNKDNNVFVDSTLKANGHGVYIKKDIEIIKKAQTKKILDNALECVIPESIYQELINLIESGE